MIGYCTIGVTDMDRAQVKRREYIVGTQETARNCHRQEHEDRKRENSTSHRLPFRLQRMLRWVHLYGSNFLCVMLVDRLYRKGETPAESCLPMVPAQQSSLSLH